MRTSMALFVKFVLTFVASLIAFYFLVENGLEWVLVVAIVGTALNYLIGDLAVLPSMGNIVASIGDGAIAALTAYILDTLSAFSTTWTSLLWFGVIITIGEFFFHEYLLKDEKVAPENAPEPEKK